MKLLLAFLALAAAAHAATFSLDPIAAIRALHAHTPVSTRLRESTMWFAIGGNIADWVMTRHFVYPSGNHCELNPQLQLADGCSLNQPKFDALKFGVTVALFAEEGTHQFLKHKAATANTAAAQAKWLKRDDSAEKIGIIVNTPLDVLFGVLTTKNAIEVAK